MTQLRPRSRRLAILIAAGALFWAALTPVAAAADGVLVVGDSLEVGTSPYLQGLLHGIPLTVDAQTIRHCLLESPTEPTLTDRGAFAIRCPSSANSMRHPARSL